MIEVIELTDEDGQMVIVNPSEMSYVTSRYPGYRGANVYMSNGKSFSVKEPMTEVLEKVRAAIHP